MRRFESCRGHSAPCSACHACGVSWTNLVPAIGQAREYRREWLAKDVVAGVVLTGLLGPAGMAYAAAAGLPPVTGLYATIVPLLVYALFGPSRILVIGPDSALTPLIVAAVVPLAAAGSQQAVAVAGALGIIAGVIGLSVAASLLWPRPPAAGSQKVA